MKPLILHARLNCTWAWWLNHGLGCFFVDYLGSLVSEKTSPNAIRYVELLGNHLHPFMLFCYPNTNGVFQQDNSSSHKSRLATAGWMSIPLTILSSIGHLEAKT
ncbi:uncharacterized protein TNCV_2702641 [Trichonephila clavipes]|nr:uncharacterized protein TNCV_2702641 [Trichonephila clavipes]